MLGLALARRCPKLRRCHDLPKLARLWENRPGGGRPQRLALLRRQLAQVHDTQWALWRWGLLARRAWELSRRRLALWLARLVRLLAREEGCCLHHWKRWIGWP